jgi:putative ABC transport system permease protein
MKGFTETLKTLLSHWRLHPMQLTTLVIGLICATALWSGVQALNQQARMSYDRAAAIFGGARTASLVSRDGGTFSQSLFIDLRRGGWAVSPILEDRIQTGGQSFRLIGIEPITMSKEAGAIADMDGSSLEKFLMPPYRTLISADTLNEIALKAGDTPQLKSGVLLPPLAISPMLAPGVMVVDIGVAQRALGKADQISRLLVAPKALGPMRPLRDIAGKRLQLVAPDAESGLERLTDSFHLNLTAFGLLSFAVGLFIVNSAIGLTFEQRLPMFRTIRACGVSALTLNAALLAELVSLALIAGLVGMMGGYAVAAVLLPDVAASLRGLYGAEIPGQLTLQPSWWMAGLAMSIVGTLAAAANVLVKLQRMPVLDSAQPNAWKQVQQKWLKRQSVLAALVFLAAIGCFVFGDSLGAGFGLLGAMLLSAALALPVILSVLLWLGERWAGRSVPGRPMVKWFWADSHQQLSGLSLALMALLLAIAVNVGVSTMVGSFRETFVNWLDGRLAADLYLDAESDARASDIKAWLQKRPEPIAILPGGRTETTLNGAPVELFGLANDAGYRARWPLLDAASNGWNDIQGGHAAFISEQLSRRSKIKLNDIVHVPSDAGDWPLKIVGVYADYGNPKGQLAVDFDALARQFPQMPRTRIALRIAPDHVAALVEALKTEFKLNDRQIADQSAVKAESKRIFERTFAVTAALNSFTLGVAAIALLTSLLTLGNARLPQWAPLWAIGITLPRLAVAELLKMLGLALLTALLAIPLGLAVGWCLVAVVNVQAFGWRLPLHIFPLQLVELLGISMLAALLATIVPVLRLARMPPARLVKIFANER